MKTITFFLFLYFACAVGLQAQTLHLYGGKDNKDYLGCINCNKYDSNSIWNAYGTYGSRYSSSSIWNAYSTYGSKYNSYSPWNAYSSSPPAVVDKNGNFYGYFTVNKYKSQRFASSLALNIYEYHEYIREDVAEWYDKIF